MKWTKQQFESITTTGRSLLVSAAAGSGKTAVLAERCAYLVCDAPQKSDIDELLVVTFTKAAAAEMKTRIEAALRKRLENSPNDRRLTKQLLLLNRAQISTLHGFCTSFLRRHFHVIDLDPNFRVLDEEEVRLLKHETARQLLDERYESDQSGQFQQFIDQYGTGDDQLVLGRVLHLHEMMCSVIDPDGWLNEKAKLIGQAKNAVPLVKSDYGKQLAGNIREWLNDLQARWLVLARHIAEIDGLQSYGEYVNELLAAVGSWQLAFSEGNFDALSKEIAQFDAGRLPTMRNAPPEKEIVQAQIDAIRKEMKQGAIASQCRFTEQQWRDGLAAIYPAAKIFVDLTRDFRKRFDQAKRELRGLDFSDLERLTLKILRENAQGADLSPSSIARIYHKQLAHVLVDEYQDINEVQDAILGLVSRECVVGEKDAITNLFCVGDVKQSIYRFRLAAPRRFLDRYGNFRKTSSIGTVIDLSSNFRSRGPLLEVINCVFERLMVADAVDIQYDRSHRLTPGASYPVQNGQISFVGAPVELHLLSPPQATAPHDDAPESDLDRTEREAALIAQKISQLIESRTNVAEKTADGALAFRAIQYRDIVILLRSMRYKSEQFVRILRSAGIPVHSESGTGFFDSMEIRDMLSLLRILDNQQQDVPLAALLRSPLSGLAQPDDCLARIRLKYRDAHEIPFHRAVVLYAEKQTDEVAAQLKAILRDVSDWRRLAHQRPLAEVIWHIYDRTGYLAFCAGMEDGQQRVANLIDFYERARQFGSFHRQGLSRFMQFLDSLAEQSDLGSPSIASEADDVVRIMSVHRSKGLEFPLVIVPDLGKKHNLQDAQGTVLVDRDAGIGLMVADEKLRVKYPSLAHALVQDRIKQQTLAEEMRVLYVAMTRAREHLILVGTCEESLPQQWRDEWTAHEGPLPSPRILAAGRMLDWIGPAAAMMDNGIEISWHGDEELNRLSSISIRRPKLSDEQMKYARLEPLDPAPASSAEVEQLKKRLTAPYPFDDFTQLRAAESVGSLTKLGRFAPAGQGAFREEIVEFDEELPAARCAGSNSKLRPTEIGSATHLVLEHLDFGRACDRADLQAQIKTLIDKKLLDPAFAEVIDLDGILWFTETELGKLFRRNAAALRREVSVYYPQVSAGLPSSADPMDRVMVRGRIDVLIPDADGMILADFKTDQLTQETVAARAEFYRPQITAYRDAIVRITGKAVKSSYLVFLQPRILSAV